MAASGILQRNAVFLTDSRGQIPEAISIRERPAEVEDRAVPGHWEGDLLSGSKNSYIATLVERHSRFAMLIKVPSKETEAVVAALSQQVRKLPATLRRSLTWDRGLEMAKHKDFTVAREVQVYFCDPQSPWPIHCLLRAVSARRHAGNSLRLLPRRFSPSGNVVVAFVAVQFVCREMTKLWQSQVHADSLYVNGLLGLFANVYLIKGHFIGDVVFIDVANVLHGLLADVFRCDEFYVPEPLVGI